jgi:polyferredoxin
LDAHCGCARCLAQCDADAAEGRILLNGTWWWNQRAFVVEHSVVTRGFEVAR